MDNGQLEARIAELETELASAVDALKFMTRDLDSANTRIGTLEEELDDARQPRDAIARWSKLRNGRVHSSAGQQPWVASFEVGGVLSTGHGEDALDAILAAEENYHWSKK